MLKASVPGTQAILNTQLETSDLPSDMNLEDYAPVRIFEIDLEEVLPVLSAVNEQTGYIYRHGWCLIRLHSQPLGVVELDFEDHTLAPKQYVQRIWAGFQAQINEHLNMDGLPPILELTIGGITTASTPACRIAREQFLTNAPFVSVIVPTHDRPDRLKTSIHSLLALSYPRYEIIIVDNAPSTSATLELVQQARKDAPHLLYLREDRSGISWARNRGITAAKGEIIAFTDDDVLVDTHWLTELVRAFSFADDVLCTTGAIMPLELETPSQRLFERYTSLDHKFKFKIFNMKEHHPKTFLFPFINNFGAGVSMAFTAPFIRQLGGFDPNLGGEGPSHTSEDTDAFFQVIIQGHTLVNNPAALLYHQHRRTFAGLRKQIYGYGVGFTAYVTKNLWQRPSLTFRLLVNIPRGLFRMLKARSNKSSAPLTKSTPYPKELTWLELKGMLYGPFAYLQTRRLMRRKATPST